MQMKRDSTRALLLVVAVLMAACSSDRGTSPSQHPDVELEAMPASLVPPELPWDFYPQSVTRDQLLARLPEAVPRSGPILANETWSSTIHLTGDIFVNDGVTLTIEPGTWVLVAARSDDQAGGEAGGDIDVFNPKDPPYRGVERTELRIQGSLIVRGTREQPVIITSDARHPCNDDWGSMLLTPGKNGEVEISRAIIEFVRYIDIGSAKVAIRQSILRNMMGCVVIGGNMCAVLDRVPLDLTPTLTQNHIYNTGRHAVTIRSGAPRVTHNIIRARPDLETTGWEQGALGTDVPTCAVIQYNYLDGSRPKLYHGEIFGHYYEYTQAGSAGLNGVCDLTFSYNTLTGSPLALETHAGNWSIEHNNLLPIRAPEPAASAWLMAGSLLAVIARDWKPEPSDLCQIQFLEQIGGLPLVKTVSVPHNYWGTTDPALIEQLLWSDSHKRRFDYQPFEEAFIVEALPDWREFEW